MDIAQQNVWWCINMQHHRERSYISQPRNRCDAISVALNIVSRCNGMTCFPYIRSIHAKSFCGNKKCSWWFLSCCHPCGSWMTTLLNLAMSMVCFILSKRVRNISAVQHPPRIKSSLCLYFNYLGKQHVEEVSPERVFWHFSRTKISSITSRTNVTCDFHHAERYLR